MTTQRNVNPGFPNLRRLWDNVFNLDTRGKFLVADHVANMQWEELKSEVVLGKKDAPKLDDETAQPLFKDNKTNSLFVNFHLPHSWVPGTVLHPHVHWIREAHGTVIWLLEYKFYGAKDDYPLTWQSRVADCSSAEFEGVPVSVVTNFLPPIPSISHRYLSLLDCKISRLGKDNLDTYNMDARFSRFDVNVMTQGHGSFRPYVRGVSQEDLAGA